jgi:hypothetical protein
MAMAGDAIELIGTRLTVAFVELAQHGGPFRFAWWGGLPDIRQICRIIGRQRRRWGGLGRRGGGRCLVRYRTAGRRRLAAYDGAEGVPDARTERRLLGTDLGQDGGPRRADHQACPMERRQAHSGTAAAGIVRSAYPAVAIFAMNRVDGPYGRVPFWFRPFKTCPSAFPEP